MKASAMAGGLSDIALGEWSADDILALYAKLNIYGQDFPVVSMKSWAGRRICRSVNKGIAHLVLAQLWDQIKRRHRLNSTSDVRAHYDTAYGRDRQAPASQILQAFEADKHPKLNAYKINTETVIHADARVASILPTIKIGDAIEMLAPRTVCEVGSGMRRNLFYFANRFRDVRFAGYEVSANGVNSSKRLQQIALHDTKFGKLYRLSENCMEAVQRIEFNEGSAYELPCEDNSFNVVCTIAVLEQMAGRYPEALSELRRISKNTSSCMNHFQA